MSKFAILIPIMFSIGSGLSCKRQIQEQQKKPNIVFILVDDLGYKDLGITGSTYYETPNIDKLALEGTIFNQGYAASRVCSPSRASIMTGKFTARHGITDWIGAKSGTSWRENKRHNKVLPAPYSHALSVEDISLGEALQNAGYKTFYAGKWHLGGVGSSPEDHGFGINIGGWEKGSPIGGYFSPWQNPKLQNKMAGENLSLRLAKETANFIKTHKDQSFFAFLSFYAVHGPIQTTETNWKKYRDKAVSGGVRKTGYVMEADLPIRIVQDNPIYGGLIESMDQAVGVVLNALCAAGLEDETIVIFTSDNGGVASGDSFSTSNLPLRGGKGYQWEGGLRVPFFIKAPWLQPAIKETDFPVTGTDFYPTILDLVGIDPLPAQHLDGISLKPILEGSKVEVRRPLFWHYPHYGNQGGAPSSIILENRRKLIHYWEDGRDELYQLKNDVAEMNNVVAENPEITRDLQSKLLNWLKGNGAELPAMDQTYNANLAALRHKKNIDSLMPQLESNRRNMLAEDFMPNADWWGSRVTKD